jgi:hypothetical protein
MCRSYVREKQALLLNYLSWSVPDETLLRKPKIGKYEPHTKPMVNLSGPEGISQLQNTSPPENFRNRTKIDTPYIHL